MNEALKVLYDRRSIRRYKNEQISREEMDAVIRAGVCAASGKNGQSAIIIAVQDKEPRDLRPGRCEEPLRRSGRKPCPGQSDERG